MSESKTTGGGVGVFGLMGTAFVVLKLVGQIDWSWWWVLAPFWAPLAIVLAIFVVMFAHYAIADVLSTRKARRRAGLR